MENIFYANSNQKKAGVAILIYDKIDFKSRDKEEYMLIKGLIQQTDIIRTFTQWQAIKIYEVDRYEGVNKEFYNNSWSFNTPLTVMDKTTTQKINKEIEDINSIINQLDLITFHPAIAYTLFSNAHGTFFSIDHMLGHKLSLNRF